MSFSVPPEKSEVSVKEEPTLEATDTSVTQFQEAQINLTAEEVVEIIKKSIVFGINEEEVYCPEKLTKWCTNITEECIQRLADLKKPFKYVVFCDVGQNFGNGMHHTITTFWDRLKDRVFTETWTNQTIIAIVTVICVCTEITRDTMM
uniref:Dynein light chain Tctex-type 1 n=1 Tax=Lygus hesperus TaxID=30085 RepID=A0A0A9YIW9_LYGHE